VAGIKETVERGIEQLVAGEGYEFVHMELKRGSGVNLLQIFIDKTGGVTLDDCQSVSKQISTFLDVEEPIQHKYVLEVSSPGLDRGLYRESDYVRFSGRKTKVKTIRPMENRRNFFGYIQASGDGKVRLTEPNGKEWAFDISAIEKANLEIEI
jgi:ribosome maturation factor RimP